MQNFARTVERFWQQIIHNPLKSSLIIVRQLYCLVQKMTNFTLYRPIALKRVAIKGQS